MDQKHAIDQEETFRKESGSPLEKTLGRGRDHGKGKGPQSMLPVGTTFNVTELLFCGSCFIVTFLHFTIPYVDHLWFFRIAK